MRELAARMALPGPAPAQAEQAEHPHTTWTWPLFGPGLPKGKNPYPQQEPNPAQRPGFVWKTAGSATPTTTNVQSACAEDAADDARPADAKTETVARFLVNELTPMEKAWDAMSLEDRETKVIDVVKAACKKIGLPWLGVVVRENFGALAQFHPRQVIILSRGIFSSDALATPIVVMAVTHEIRHAIQAFDMARYLFGRGQSVSDVYRFFYGPEGEPLNRSDWKEAQRSPIAPCSAQEREVQELLGEKITGVSSIVHRERHAAQDKLEALNNSEAPTEQIGPAAAEYQKWNSEYRKLPSERAAFDAGDRGKAIAEQLRKNR